MSGVDTNMLPPRTFKKTHPKHFPEKEDPPDLNSSKTISPQREINYLFGGNNTPLY